MKTERKTPQFSMKQLYASLFASEHKFCPDGSKYEEELSHSTPVTGINKQNEFLHYLRIGNRPVKGIASLHGSTRRSIERFPESL